MLRERIAGYFAFCDENGKYYTRYGLASYLEICMDTLNRWEKGRGASVGEGQKEDSTLRGIYSEEIKKALTRINAQLEERVDSKSVFLSKQSCYMGYAERDKQEKGTAQVIVRLDVSGVGAKKRSAPKNADNPE